MYGGEDEKYNRTCMEEKMRITILAVGKVKEKFYRQAIEE